MSTPALVVVDVQVGFCAGGGLPVPDGDAVVPVINALAARFEHVVLTQDWHAPGHASFASSHPGRAPFDVIDLPPNLEPQVLWPDHCVQGTRDAEFHPDLKITHAQAIIRKGTRRDVDSYSGFLEADRFTPTGLDGYLRSRGIDTVYVCGLATDFCVAWTALDARAAGYRTLVIEDACRAIDADGSLAEAWRRLEAAGVERIESVDL
ncbi:bifunctional nicotinamidase/pyrazinamidase [soil metagenome]